MKLLKRLISIICIITILISAIGIIPANATQTTFGDLKSDYACFESVIRLNELDIVNGYEDGTFRPWNLVTRAEFCKIVVSMMDKVTEAKSTPPASTFDDVNNVKWCIPYVNYLTSTGVIKGYADATFKPSNIITYAEAVTIICRVLGYKEENIGYSWPSNYINQAKALNLTTEELGAKDGVTRALMAIIVDNALFTNVNGQSDKKYLESINYTVLEDSYIIASSENDASLKSNQIRTDSGIYEVKNSTLTEYQGSTGTLIVNKDMEAVSFKEDEFSSLVVVVTDVKDNNTIEYRGSGNIKGSYTFTKNFTVYYDNSKTTYSAVQNEIEDGTQIEFKGEHDGRWTFAIIDSDNNSVSPVRASKNYTSNDTTLEGIIINFDNLTVYRDNKTASVSDIRVDDVVYYNTKSNVMDVYNKKVTGIYNEALPSKAYVSSVNVGGNVYSINSKVSTSKLDASTGSFDIGDRVTLLLGKNDEVCFAVQSSGFDKFEYGVVLKTYTQIAQSGENEGSSCIMASMFMPDGNIYEYETARDYKDYIGELVKISYTSDKITMSTISQAKVYGDVNKTKRTIDGKTVLKDAAIFHRLSDEEAATAQVELLDFDTLDATTISSSQVITTVSSNAFGDLAIIYLCDMASGYSYGYLKGIEDMSNDNAISVKYKIFDNSIISEYTSSSKYAISGGPVSYKQSGGKLTDLKSLYTIKSGRKINAVEGGRIMVDNTIYTMTDNVQIIDATNSTNLKVVSVNDLNPSKVSSVVLYSDKHSSQDPIIRLVKVTISK